jgi:phosphoribosylglycinamide formyltransferase-1
MPDDDAQQLAARVRVQEHRIYPRAVQWFCDGRLQIQDGRVEIAALNDGCAADAALLVP